MRYRDKIRLIVERFSDRVAVRSPERGKEITFGEMDRRTNAMVRVFREAGLGKGDKIALLCRNGHHYREMFWTAAKGGFVLVPLNTRLKPRELSYILEDSEAECLVCSAEFLEVGRELREALGGLRHTFSVDPGARGWIDLEGRLAEASAEPVTVPLAEDDLLWFQYTSGTTGLPKGAMLTQAVASAIVDICTDAVRGKGFLGDDARALQLLPSSAFAGMAFDLIYQWTGVPVIVMERFDATEMMRLIEAYRITDCHIVPVILNFLLASPDFGKYDLSSLQCVTYGGAPMPRELLRRGIEALGRIFMQDYGCSEAGALTLLDPEDHVLEGSPEEVARLMSCGRPIPGVDVKVLDEEGREVAPGEIGELTTRSPMVMKDYWHLPEETERVLKDGRFYTGDLGTVDEAGYVYIKDRKKEMIISGGYNIYPFEVENTS